MDWRPIIVTACYWTLPVAAVDIGYMIMHGIDGASIGFTVIAVLPAWAFLGRNVKVEAPGVKLEITHEEIGKTKEEFKQSAPDAIARIESDIKVLSSGDPQAAQLINKSSLKVTTVVPSDTVSLIAEPIGKATRRRMLFPWNDVFYVVDPNLALVNLRIEIERRVKRIAEILHLDVPSSMPLSQMVHELTQRKILDKQFARALQDYIRYGNQAAHGAVVEPQAANDILESQDLVLDTLNDIVERLSRVDKTAE